jgi:hypothetical protein
VDRPATTGIAAAEPIVTGPDWSHPALATAVRGLSDVDRQFMADPMNSDPFRYAMSEQVTRPLHRLGGYAYPVQDAVETPPLTLLAQIDSDEAAGMM